MVELDCINSGNNVTVIISVTAAFLQRGRYSLVILFLVLNCGFT